VAKAVAPVQLRVSSWQTGLGIALASVNLYLIFNLIDTSIFMHHAHHQRLDDDIAYSSCSQVEDSRSDTGTLAQSTNLWQALFALCLQPCFQAA